MYETIRVKKPTVKLLRKARAKILNENPDFKGTYDNTLRMIIKKFMEGVKNG